MHRNRKSEKKVLLGGDSELLVMRREVTGREGRRFSGKGYEPLGLSEELRGITVTDMASAYAFQWSSSGKAMAVMRVRTRGEVEIRSLHDR